LDLQTLNAGSKLCLDPDILTLKCQPFDGFCKKCYLFVTFFCYSVAAHTPTIHPKRLNKNRESYTFPLGYFNKSIKYFSIFPINLTQLYLFLVVMCSHFVHMYIDLSFYLSISEKTHWLHLTEIRDLKGLWFLQSS
jgi:uncharacterized membrane protein